MILQITTTTAISLTIGQAVTMVISIVTILGLVVAGYYKLINEISKLRDKYRLLDDTIEINMSITERKIDKLEENSKQWYKLSDAKNEELKSSIDNIAKLITEMNLKLEVHLAKCSINHKNE